MFSPTVCRYPANTKSVKPVAVVQFNCPGLARASASSSFSELTFSAAGTLTATTVLEMRAIGMRSFGRRELVVKIRVRGERTHRRHQQDMIVVRAQEAGDGEHAIAARTIFDDDGLAPTHRQLVGEQPRADIDAAAGSERYDEPNRPAGPSICRGSWTANDRGDRARRAAISAERRPNWSLQGCSWLLHRPAGHSG